MKRLLLVTTTLFTLASCKSGTKTIHIPALNKDAEMSIDSRDVRDVKDMSMGIPVTLKKGDSVWEYCAGCVKQIHAIDTLETEDGTLYQTWAQLKD